MKPTIETGAMTLVLLVKYYKSQMIALLLKNGVTVPKGASDKQIAMLMANLLKVSKSFYTDLNSFIQNPKVIEVLAGGVNQNAEYFKASGYSFTDNLPSFDPNFFSTKDNATTATTTVTDSATTPPKKTGFFSGLNLGNLLSQGLGVFGSLDKNKTDRAIADAQAQISANTGAGFGIGSSDSGSGNEKNPDDGMSTTTIVVLSLVGIAVIGTIFYFIAKPKQ